MDSNKSPAQGTQATAQCATVHVGSVGKLGYYHGVVALACTVIVS